MEIQEFVTNLGFEFNPFQSVNADQEATILGEYFITPDYFEDLWGDKYSPISSIIYAPRGGGKSAQRIMIEKKATESGDVLPIDYTKHDLSAFSKIEEVTISYHLVSLNKLLLIAFFKRLSEFNESPFEAFNYTERQYIFNLAKKYLSKTPNIYPKNEVKKFKKLPDKASDFWRTIKAPFSDFIKSATKKQGFEIDLSSVQGNKQLEGTHRENLKYLVDCLAKLGFVSIYVLVDQVDEQNLTGNDTEASFVLVRDLIKDLQLLETENLCFKFFLSDSLRPYTNTHARPDRILTFEIQWSHDKLHEMLDKRVKIYSKERVLHFEDLLEDANSLNRVLLFSEHSPRDCIRICRRIISEQFKANPYAKKFTPEIVNQSITIFAKEKAAEIITKNNDFLSQINRASFTIGKLNTTIANPQRFKINEIIALWLQKGFIKLINQNSDELKNEYAFEDIRVSYTACATLPLDKFIQDRVVQCKLNTCKLFYYRNFDECQHSCPTCYTLNP